jgi:hypothetical protein
MGMCTTCLEWDLELTVDASTLKGFEVMIKRDFNRPGLYVLSLHIKKPLRATPPSNSPPWLAQVE